MKGEKMTFKNILWHDILNILEKLKKHPAIHGYNNKYVKRICLIHEMAINNGAIKADYCKLLAETLLIVINERFPLVNSEVLAKMQSYEITIYISNKDLNYILILV